MPVPLLKRLLLLFLLVALSTDLLHAQPRSFAPADVFDIEYAADPQISPDGRQVVYARTFMDIMADRSRQNLWIVNADGSDHRPLTTGLANDTGPRWSPDGGRLAYLSSAEGSRQLFVRWMDSGQTAMVTHLSRSPGGIAWSPDGQWIAFTMFVAAPSKPMIQMPAKPEGANWAPPARVIDDVIYRRDGQGFVSKGFTHVFVVSAEGGTPRQLSSGDFNHGGTPAWTPDSRQLIISANRLPDAALQVNGSELYSIDVDTGVMAALTAREGPDSSPTVSPDGRYIAYLGYDDRYQGYQVTKLYVLDRRTGQSRALTTALDRDAAQPQWRGDSGGLFFRYDSEGNTKLAFVDLAGEVNLLAENLGGLSIGRPYGGSSFSVSATGRYAYTYSTPAHPADVAVAEAGGAMQRLTTLNADLFSQAALGEVEELWYTSSFDDRPVQGWIVKPPNFDPNRKYPLILEIHGGPFSNYGDRFSAEVQLMASAGYVVLYTNPRGSTSYGQTFGNLIHHNYPGQDYDDLMSGVDAVIAKGYIDENNLFVTGGSGGGVLTSWIIGKTNRFAAAVVAKPVINWYSFVLTADIYPFATKYWFPGNPWDHMEHYMARSPISLVGNVETPTMLLTGESDYRTPMSESEQYYQALQLREVPSVLVRIPEAGHGIAARPSNLIAKVLHIIKWFDENGSSEIVKPEG